MSEEMAVYEVAKPLSLAQVKTQVSLLQDILKHVMQDGSHYGKIPGAGDKPTLFKAGAEKIMSTFQLWPDPDVDDLSLGDMIRYRVKIKLINKVSGLVEGAGVGECSSEEEKYKWRGTVSDAEWNATPDTHKRIKYTRGGQAKQVRTNPYDLANTIVKMAKKRALVDAVLTATAASDIFTQDIEDMPPEVFDRGGNGGQKPAPQPPQSRSAQGPAPQPPAEPSEAKQHLHQELEEYCKLADGTVNKDLYNEILKKCSYFTAKDDKGVDQEYFIEDIFNPKVSTKWAGTTIGKLRKLMNPPPEA